MQGGTKSALRQEGDVNLGRLDTFVKDCPPSGGRTRLVTGSINMALLAEGNDKTETLENSIP